MADKVIIVGCGQLGRRTASCVKDRFDVVFADNYAFGQVVDDIPVVALPLAITAFPDTPFVVTVYNGQPVHEQLRAAGVKDVRHFRDFYLENADLCLPYACLQTEVAEESFDVVYNLVPLLADIKSKRLLIDTFETLVWAGKGHYPHDHPDNIYFPSFITPLYDEVFVDVGAFDGDTIRSFLRHRGGRFDRIIAFEPDSSSCWKLSEYLHSLVEFDSWRRFSIFPCAVGKTDGLTTFEADGTAASHVGAAGSPVLCATLDKILPTVPVIPTYVKCDVEGAELDVLEGARETIANYRPVLAFCLYHKQSHLWEIPLLMKEICPDYEIFVRAYASPPWEVVAYAVPAERVDWSQVQQ